MTERRAPGPHLRALLASSAMMLALGAYPACAPDSAPTFAIEITSLDQAVGGPVASGRVGDFLLQNEKIKVVIEGGRESTQFLDVGGSVIDMDLVRPEPRFRSGRGLDQLGQIATVANLNNPRATNKPDVRVTHAPNAAQVTVSAEGDGLQKIINAVNLVVQRDFTDPRAPDHAQRFYVEYDLRPGEQMLRVTTGVSYGVPFCPVTPEDGCNAECDDAIYDKDCKCPTIPARCTQGVTVRDGDILPDGPNRGLLDLFLGDLPRPLGTKKCLADADCDGGAGETCADVTQALGGVSRVCRKAEQKDAGVFMGDMLIFGGHLGVFIPGTGFDSESDIRRLFDNGGDTLATPLTLPAVYAIGDRVSYGYAAPKGLVSVPIFGGPFALGATAGASCRHDQKGCLTNKVVRWERWLAVGRGDSSTVNEVFAAARGEAQGRLRGKVILAHSGRPVSGADVYALSDPRTLPCEGECKQRCDLTGVTDDTIARWSVEQLFAANKCRTVGTPYVGGYAAVEQVAKTDVGTDTLIDGEYVMSLPPGRHVLVAVKGVGTRSELSPVEVVAGETRAASLFVVEPGRLDYGVVDERGQASPARVFVGNCFPGKACNLDSDCGGGEACEAGACACPRKALRPLELGGSRLVDGVQAFDQTANGAGRIELPPGEYDVVFTHGPHSTLDKQHVTIREATSTSAQGHVVRVVDHRNWVASDFHVHAEPSLDSGLPMRDRAVSFLAEDMEFLSSSDHDTLSKYDVLLEQLGFRKKLGTHIGVEISTQEIGHFIGYPMKYEERKDGQVLPGHDAPNWRGLPPGDIFAEARKRGREDVPFVMEVPHPYSYFDFYRIDPVTLESAPSILTVVNPTLQSVNFSADFDAMELINGKNMDLIRRPTIDELRYYSRGLDELITQRAGGALDEDTFQRRRYQLAHEAVRRILHRTKDEQQAALDGVGAEAACRCASDGDCAAGLACDHVSMTCVARADRNGIGGRDPVGNGMCRGFRGVVDDWFNMLNRGVRRTGVGGSDVHGLYDEAGMPRTMLRTNGTTSPSLSSEEIVGAIHAGRSVVTNGPMIDFRVDGAQVGDTKMTAAGQPVTLSINVQKAPFYDVDRVEVYRNGELIHWATACAGTRRQGDSPEPHGHPCVQTGETVLAYGDTIQDTPPRDAWYVVIATGIDGRPLGPAYGSVNLARFGTFEVAQRLYDIVPALTSLRTPRFPSVYPVMPVAITNPIYVDQGGDGWQPMNPPPSWCVGKRDINCQNNP